MRECQLSQNALRVLEAQYLRRDAQGTITEAPDQLFQRVAQTVAQAENLLSNTPHVAYWQNRFYHVLTSLDFLPNSPALMNAGMPLGQLSACFVLPIEDTMEGIFEALKQASLVQRTGGGTGFSFSELRPKGDLVSTTGGEASGPVSFMKIFDSATEHIKQGGKRRGANMGVLRVDHPDILEFITAKLDGKSLQNFNTSVGVTDAFLEAVSHQESYELIHPRTKKPNGRLPAKTVFEPIIQAAWQTGDPGLLFLDAINRTNPTPSLGSLEATNPCGEIPLLPNESCNLGSINLAHHICRSHGESSVDWGKLRTTVQTAVRFLDNLIEVNRFPTPEFDHMSRGNRKIGLGVMGFAELLIRLDISYNSDQAVQLSETLMRFIFDEARRTSQELAKERGVFPNWKESVYERQNLKIRNATCIAIAPTGTISIIANTTAGIEPLFALVYRHSHTMEGTPLYEMTPLLLEYCKGRVVDMEKFMIEVFTQGRLNKVSTVSEDTKQLFVTALDIPLEGHLQIQAAFQRHVDNSVCKTINLPEDTTCEMVAHAYWRAWELGLKGITVYRYGSKDSQVLELGIGADPSDYEHRPHCDPCECKV